MTKIITLATEPDLPPSQEKILQFLNRHPYEVFSIKEAKEMAPSLGLSQNNASWCFWALEKRQLIRKKRIGRRVYYGSAEAIEYLNTELGKRVKR
jgi:predicted transcriptional regulator